MAEIKTGIFAKNVQKRLSRAQEKVLQKLGKADETKDDQFDQCVQNFKRQESEGSRLQREMRAYLAAIKAMQQASINLTESLHEVYEPDWHGKEDVLSIGKDCDALWENFHQKLVDSTILALDNYLQQFPDLKIRVAKRSRKLIDYDSARHHVETMQAAGMKNDRKIMKGEEELKKAQKVFDELNVGLQDELPTLWDSRVGFYVNTFKSVTHMEAKFHREISVLCKQLYEVMMKLGEQHSDKMFTIQGAPSDSGPLRLARTPSPPEYDSSPESPVATPNHMLRPVSPSPQRPKSPSLGPPVRPPPMVTPTKELHQEQIINLFGDEFLPAPAISPCQPNERPGESLLDMDFDAFMPAAPIGQSASPAPSLPWDMWTGNSEPVQPQGGDTGGFVADWSADFGGLRANGDSVAAAAAAAEEAAVEPPEAQQQESQGWAGATQPEESQGWPAEATGAAQPEESQGWPTEATGATQPEESQGWPTEATGAAQPEESQGWPADATGAAQPEESQGWLTEATGAAQPEESQGWPTEATGSPAASPPEGATGAGDEVSSRVPNVVEPNPDFDPSAASGGDRATQESGQGLPDAAGSGGRGCEDAGWSGQGPLGAELGGAVRRKSSTPGLRITNADGLDILDTTEGSEHGLYLASTDDGGWGLSGPADQEGSGSEYETAEEWGDAPGHGGGWASADDEALGDRTAAQAGDQGLGAQGGFAGWGAGDSAASLQDQKTLEGDGGFAANWDQQEALGFPEPPPQLSAAEELNSEPVGRPNPDDEPFVGEPGEQRSNGHQDLGFVSDPFAETQGGAGFESDPFAETQGGTGFESDPFADTQGGAGFESDPFAETQGVHGFESDPFAETQGGAGFESDPFAETQGGAGFESDPFADTQGGAGFESDPFADTQGGAGFESDPFADTQGGAGFEADIVAGTRGGGEIAGLPATDLFAETPMEGGGGWAADFAAFPGPQGSRGTAKEAIVPRSHREPENSDLSEDEATNRRYGHLYQEIDTEKEEVTNNAFNGFSQDASTPPFFADFNKMDSLSQGESKDFPVEEAPTIVAEAEEEKPLEAPVAPAEAPAETGLEEEKMPIPSVVIEPASSNEGDDDRDGDIISPTTVSDNGVTPENQTAKEIGSSGQLPPDFMYKVETLHDFEAANSDELDLKRGDIVLVIPTLLAEDQDAGWLTGYKERDWSQVGAGAHKGLFPENFTQRSD